MDTLLRRRLMMSVGESPTPPGPGPGPEPPTPTGENIVFADAVVGQICAENWGDGTNITDVQAAAVTNSQFGTTFAGNTSIVSFDEFGTYFTSITAIAGGTTGNRAFEGCSNLESITIPSSVTSIGNFAFTGCSSLESFVVPSTVTSKGQAMFQGCTGLKTLTINGSVNSNSITNTSGHCGDGTGKLTIDGSIDHNSSGIHYFDFKEINISGDVTKSGSGNNVLLASNYVEKIVIGGNVNRNYNLCSSTGAEFLELGGTYNSMMLGASTPTTCVVHLKYNGVAGTPSNLRIARVAKVYVDSQAILDQYLADTDWAGYSSKLDLWENYNGVYKD